MTMGIALVGCAHGHPPVYFQRWSHEPGVSIAGVWDHDVARAFEFAEAYGLEPDTDLDALLARDTVDAVVIGAETSLHADCVVRAAGAGKAVVLQKPMALTLDQADAIVDVVESSGVPFTIAWQMRVDPQNAKMRELIRDGTLGRIYMFRRRHGLPAHKMSGFEDMWYVKPELNRGMWADDAAHPIDLVYWIFGMPETVTAEIATLSSPRIPDDHGIAIFRYADGTIAEVSSSFVCSAMENTTEVVGSKGTIVQNYGDVPSCNVPRPPGAPGLRWYLDSDDDWTYSQIPSPAGHGERIAGLAGPLLEFLRGERGPIATAREGRDALRMVLASYAAAESGSRVKV